ncbi:MAG: hypothetical protein ACTSO2_09835, partial [Promethearchaeota archaeon]
MANSPPVIQVDKVSLEGEIEVNMIGCGNEMIALRILRNGEEWGTILVGPQPAGCDGVKTTKLPVSLDLSYDWQFELFYCTVNGSALHFNQTEWENYSSQFPLNNTADMLSYGPEDECGLGFNFVWVVFRFPSGNFYATEHIFYENFLFSDSWSWTIDPESYMGLSEWKVYGKVYDRGSDDLNISVSLSKVAMLERTVPVDIYDCLSNGTLYYLFFTAEDCTITVGLGSEEITPTWEYFKEGDGANPSEFGFSFSFMPQIRDNLTIIVADDDGGSAELTLPIIETETDPYLLSLSEQYGWKMQPEIPNLSPRVELNYSGTIYEQTPKIFHADVADYYNFTHQTP